MMNTETSKNNTSENSAACVSGFSQCKDTIKKISLGARHRTQTYKKRATAGSDYANRPVRPRTVIRVQKRYFH